MTMAELAEGTALISIFLMDIGWVVSMPFVALPALVVALVFQAVVAASACQRSDFEISHATALYAWIIGNSFWMVSELLWDGSQPAGFLARIGFVTEFSSVWYAKCLSISCLFLLFTIATLVLFYACSRVFQPSPEQIHEPELHGIPLTIYSSMFILPWLVMDATWVLCDRQMLANAPVTFPWMLGFLAGSLSMVLAAESMHKFHSLKRTSAAMQSGAEGLWVCGNMVWFLGDAWDHWKGTRHADTASWSIHVAVTLFIVGLLLTVWSLGLRNRKKLGETAPLKDALPEKAW